MSRSCMLSRLATDSRLPDLTMKCSMEGEVVSFVDSAASALPALPAFNIDPAQHISDATAKVDYNVAKCLLSDATAKVVYQMAKGLFKYNAIWATHNASQFKSC